MNWTVVGSVFGGVLFLFAVVCGIVELTAWAQARFGTRGDWVMPISVAAVIALACGLVAGIGFNRG